MNKIEIRKSYLKNRKLLSKESQLEMEARIFEKLKLLDFSKINYVHVFLPILNKTEFNTLPIIKFLKENFPAIKIVIPKVDFQTGEMVSFIYEDGTILQENEFGILEPINGDIINPVLIDMILVPLLAFDKSGNRVGYGRGFYDRFFLDCKPSVQRIGISFFDAMEKEIDVEPYDVRLTSCITAEKIYNFE